MSPEFTVILALLASSLAASVGRAHATGTPEADTSLSTVTAGTQATSALASAPPERTLSLNARPRTSNEYRVDDSAGIRNIGATEIWGGIFSCADCYQIVLVNFVSERCQPEEAVKTSDGMSS
ncbi:hypothetical protein OF83DRAFT_1179128 [Amylostereum chailletii]|nr:hypothetical protein OF83DRAFT_1179128 [Amylostereum chailletii]